MKASFAKGLRRDGARVWYRHHLSGDRGYTVTHNGIKMIKLDRPSEPSDDSTLKRFRPEEWVPDTEHRPLTRAQIAQICKAQDQKLCYFLGMYKEGKQDWREMHQDEQRDWIQGKGPEKPKARQVTFRMLYDFYIKHAKDI